MDFRDFGYLFGSAIGVKDIVAIVLGLVLGLAGIIAMYVFVLPKRNVPYMNRFLRTIRDIFLFRTLLLEKVLRFLFILLSIPCITCGIVYLFIRPGVGITLLLQPIWFRIVFEILMIVIMQVQNLIEINEKLPGSPHRSQQQTRVQYRDEEPDAYQQQRARAQQQSRAQAQAQYRDVEPDQYRQARAQQQSSAKAQAQYRNEDADQYRQAYAQQPTRVQTRAQYRAEKAEQYQQTRQEQSAVNRERDSSQQ